MITNRPLAAITGASSGLGEEFARALAKRGYDLLLIARRKDRLDTLARDLKDKNGAAVEVISADLTLDAGMQIVEDRLRSIRDLDLLVNNAGFGVGGRFTTVEVDGQDKMIRLHILATMRLMHSVLGNMVARNAGAVINVSSVAGFLVSPGAAGYASSKYWINAFTEGVWMELQATGSRVKVQSLCPGFVRTEFHDAAGMSRDKLAPPQWWMTPQFVVAASLDALNGNQLFVVPGTRYKIVVALTGLLPRSWRRSIMIRWSRRTGRLK
jgi:short-subunit dehydrogenase